MPRKAHICILTLKKIFRAGARTKKKKEIGTSSTRNRAVNVAKGREGKKRDFAGMREQS